MTKLNTLVKKVEALTQDNYHTEAVIEIAKYLVAKDDGELEEDQTGGIELNVLGMLESLKCARDTQLRKGYMSSEDLEDRTLITKLLMCKLTSVERQRVSAVM